MNTVAISTRPTSQAIDDPVSAVDNLSDCRQAQAPTRPERGLSWRRFPRQRRSVRQGGWRRRRVAGNIRSYRLDVFDCLGCPDDLVTGEVDASPRRDRRLSSIRAPPARARSSAKSTEAFDRILQRGIRWKLLDTSRALCFALSADIDASFASSEHRQDNRSDGAVDDHHAPNAAYQPRRAGRAVGCMRLLRRVAVRLSNQRLSDCSASSPEGRPASNPSTLMSSSSAGQ